MWIETLNDGIFLSFGIPDGNISELPPNNEILVYFNGYKTETVCFYSHSTLSWTMLTDFFGQSETSLQRKTNPVSRVWCLIDKVNTEFLGPFIWYSIYFHKQVGVGKKILTPGHIYIMVAVNEVTCVGREGKGVETTEGEIYLYIYWFFFLIKKDRNRLKKKNFQVDNGNDVEIGGGEERGRVRKDIVTTGRDGESD